MYVHIPYGAFVALEISGGVLMRFFRCFGLFFECYNLAGWRGLKACAKYLCGILQLEEPGLQSSDFSLGGSDA